MRGITLIELMICTAMIGIVAAGGHRALEAPVQASMDAVVVERARQWLDYEAECATRGVSPEPQVRALLREGIPAAAFARRPAGPGLVELVVSFRRPDGRAAERSLTVQGS